MIKEIELKYTVYNLIELVKDKWGTNSTEHLAELLDKLLFPNQMQILIDFLEAERTND